MPRWTAIDMPDLSGKTAIVTGANSGIGFHTALELARKGATVTLGCRNAERGRQSLERIRREVPGGNVELILIDLADLASVRRFAEEYGSDHECLDILVNNAGVLGIPFRLTNDAFEMQFGVNYLAHFALTGLLLPLLLIRGGARVVNLSTFVVNHTGDIDFDNLNGQKKYDKWDAYCRAKLANLVFTKELDRRYRENGLISSAAHPGFAVSNLQYAGPRMEGSKVKEAFFKIPTMLFAKPTRVGALPSLYAACAPGVEGGSCYAPQGPGQIRGRTGPVSTPERASDTGLARRLWQVSETLTGVSYPTSATSTERTTP